MAIKAAEDNRVSKVITLAGVCGFKKRTATTGNLEQWKKEGVKYVLNGRTKQQMPHYYQFFEDFNQNESRLTIKRAVEKLSIPMLIIHGNMDTSVFIHEAESLHKWNPNSQFKIIENADHMFNISHPWNLKKVSKELETATKQCIDFLR